MLALMVERGSPGRAMRPGVSSPAPAPASVSLAAGVRPVVQLLADVRGVFAARGDPDRIASAELDRALHALPGRSWGAMPKTGKPITAQARGRMRPV